MGDLLKPPTAQNIQSTHQTLGKTAYTVTHHELLMKHRQENGRGPPAGKCVGKPRP